MNDNEIGKFGLLLTTVGELYGKPVSKQLIEIYWSSLRTFAYSEVQSAVYRHINNPDSGKYLPKPSDIVTAIIGGNETRSLQAWTKVDNAIKHIGGYSSVVFDDEIVHAVISDMGGWIDLCMTRKSAMPFCAKEFQTRYCGYLHNRPQSWSNRLIGIFETQNLHRGYPCAPPILIGDKQKALRVMEGGTQKKVAIHHIKNLIEKSNEEKQ